MKYKQIRLGPKFIFMMISVMMPLWIYLEEGFFLDDVDVTIPYFDILKSLFMFVVPLFIGESMPKYLLQHTAASHMQKIHIAFFIHVLTFLLRFQASSSAASRSRVLNSWVA